VAPISSPIAPIASHSIPISLCCYSSVDSNFAHTSGVGRELPGALHNAMSPLGVKRPDACGSAVPRMEELDRPLMAHTGRSSPDVGTSAFWRSPDVPQAWLELPDTTLTGHRQACSWSTTVTSDKQNPRLEDEDGPTSAVRRIRSRF
jgi:hypothetical protein